MKMGMRLGAAAGVLVLAAGLSGFTGDGQYDARIQRIAGGIPYISADDYASLGYGTGYAMAQDMPCLLARQFVTFGAQRARYLGNTQANRNSDFFYQLFIDRGNAQQKVDPRQADLFKGAAAGYNRYLTDTGAAKLPNPACRGADWVRPIKAIDFRRVSRMPFILPHMKDMIVAAAPPSPDDQQTDESREEDQALAEQQVRAMQRAARRATRPDHAFGSNGIAIGKQASANQTGMLLANPHQPWHGTARFYAFAQSIPGEFFVVGANKVGRPQVGFGATRQVAWTSTVSTAPRTTFYRLKLVPGHPTQYMFDGEPHQMKRTTVDIKVKDDNGKLVTRRHTFYTTHFGAYLVGGKFPWNAHVAYAVRVATGGWRGVDALTAIYQAKNVHELAAVEDQYQFSPANVIAADSAGDVFYGDPGPVPNLSAEQRADCKVAGGLDGSRSACMWRSADQAAAPGILPPAKLPHLFRSDYVANMNDSFWLTNPNQPMTGYADSLGSTETERTLRTRSGLYQIEQHLAGKDGDKGDGYTLAQLQSLLMNDLSYTGVILRDDLVKLCKKHPKVKIKSEDDKPSTTVDISQACDVLARWDLHADLDSRGVALFREFMNEGISGEQRKDYQPILPPDWHYRVAFDPAHPVTTPRGLDTEDNPDVLQALARAVNKLRDAGVALDAPLGELQYVTRNGKRIPIHGGTNADGLLNIIGAPFDADAGGYPRVTGSSSSWIQATEFTDDGPVSRGLLIYSESTTPESPHYADQTRRFSQKRWIDLPFDADALDAAEKSSRHLSSSQTDKASN